jgi:hypothetical protein
LGLLGGAVSMREAQENMNSTSAIATVAALSMDPELKELPNYATINNCFEKLDMGDLQEVIASIVSSIVNSKAFIRSRLLGFWWRVAMAPLSFTSSAATLTPGSCTASTGTARWSMHAVLEAKLILNGCAFSVASVFIENGEAAGGDAAAEESEDGRKQM